MSREVIQIVKRVLCEPEQVLCLLLLQGRRLYRYSKWENGATRLERRSAEVTRT
jgi:hypothetical protein